METPAHPGSPLDGYDGSCSCQWCARQFLLGGPESRVGWEVEEGDFRPPPALALPRLAQWRSEAGKD